MAMTIPAPTATSAQWVTVRAIAAWVAAASPLPPEMTAPMQALKVQEEAGEVAAAVHGVLGYNPRKGHSHTWEDVQAELCDVILTGMTALASITPDAEAVFAARLAHIAERAGLGEVGR